MTKPYEIKEEITNLLNTRMKKLIQLLMNLN